MIHAQKVIGWTDEQLGIGTGGGIGLRILIAEKMFDCPHAGGADREFFYGVIPEHSFGGRGQKIFLRMHGVILHIFRLDRAESAQPHGQGEVMNIVSVLF